MLQRFYITSLGKDRIILGYPFLYDFNPKINWKTGKVSGEPVQLQSSRFMYSAKRIFFMQREAIKQLGQPKEDKAIYVRQTNIAQEWAQKADKDKIHLTIDTIPKEYRRHQKVFSEEEARRFPPARSEDMMIKLTPDAPKELNCKVYPLSKDERELLQKWILEEEELGRICYRPLDPGTSPPRSTGISVIRTTRWSWMTRNSGKIGLVLFVYASPDVDGLHESPCDSALMYVTRSPVSSCPVPCAPYPVPCTL
jgi:hypothetical protein